MKKKKILGLTLAGITALTGGFLLTGCKFNDSTNSNTEQVVVLDDRALLKKEVEENMDFVRDVKCVMENDWDDSMYTYQYDADNCVLKYDYVEVEEGETLTGSMLAYGRYKDKNNMIVHDLEEGVVFTLSYKEIVELELYEGIIEVIDNGTINGVEYTTTVEKVGKNWVLTAVENIENSTSHYEVYKYTYDGNYLLKVENEMYHYNAIDREYEVSKYIATYTYDSITLAVPAELKQYEDKVLSAEEGKNKILSLANTYVNQDFVLGDYYYDADNKILNGTNFWAWVEGSKCYVVSNGVKYEYSASNWDTYIKFVVLGYNLPTLVNEMNNYTINANPCCYNISSNTYEQEIWVEGKMEKTIKFDNTTLITIGSSTISKETVTLTVPDDVKSLEVSQ